ncbi:MAG: hypothetical protein EKK59_00780 [Neisseriaceae bacterium]|nr:MAG: hypothetical protein EKK59_00780 [Neisseriaceae bacterium]
MKHAYRLSLIALALTAGVVPRVDAANEAEERAKRQLTLLQKKLDTLQQGFSEQEKALRDANKRNLDLQRELNSTRTVMRWIGANPAALQQIGNSPDVVQGDAPASAVKPEAAPELAGTPESGMPAPAASEPASAAPANKIPKVAPTPETSGGLPLRPASEPKAAGVADRGDWQALLGDPVYLGGGVAVLLGGGVWLWSRRRRKSNTPVFEDSLLAHNPPTKNIVIGSTGGAVIDTTLAMNSMFKEEDLAAVALDPSSIDPVAEAEVYLAYGRDSQAEEILQDALSKMPDRQDIRLKLMEIYSARGDLRHFETTLADMQATGINKEESIWRRVEQLCAGFGPKNPLIHDAEDQPSFIHGSSLAAASEVMNHQPQSDHFSLNLTSAPPASEARQPDTIEMVLVGGAPEAEGIFVAPGPDSSAIERGLDLLLPDVDLETSAPADVDAQLESDVAQIDGAAVPVATGALDEGPTPLVTRINPDTLLNFDFEFDATPAAESENVAQPENVQQTTAEVAPINLDFGGISLDLDTQTVDAGVKDAPAEIELAMDDIDSGEEDPIDIKISLARAYMDMGDRDSANEILQEVLDEGNASQGKLAREMLEDMRSAA